MKKILLLAVFATLLQACVPKMIIDTKGRSGTFDYSRAEDLTNDKIICQELVKDNVNLVLDYTRFAFTKYVEIGTIGLIKANELQSKKINRECLKNRGHSILD